MQTRMDWARWIGDMTTPEAEVREAREAGRTLAEHAALLADLVVELWGEDETPEDIESAILAALEAAA